MISTRSTATRRSETREIAHDRGHRVGAPLKDLRFIGNCGLGTLIQRLQQSSGREPEAAIACPAHPETGGAPAELPRPIAHLRISKADDPSEREADTFAAKAVANSTGNSATAMAMPVVVSRSPATEPQFGISDHTSRRIERAGGSEALPRSLRSSLEPRLGANFSSVRLHTGPEAASAAAELNAQAFTFGRHIWLGRGKSSDDVPLMAHELIHVLQQTPALGSGWTQNLHSVSAVAQRQTLTAGVDPIDAAIARARERYPTLADALQQVTYRVRVTSDRAVAKITGSGVFTYPYEVHRSRAGFYLIQWDNTDLALPRHFIDLDTGREFTPWPIFGIKAGAEEERNSRRGRFGVVHITLTVTKPPAPRAQLPEDMQLELAPFEISASAFRQVMELFPPRPLTILGITGGTFLPDVKGLGGKRGYYGRPLNFTYYTQTGEQVLVSRELVGRAFYYLVPIRNVEAYLRIYPIEYGLRSAETMASLAQIATDISIGFLPIVGPLYGLAMAARSSYQAYKNWDRMTGWQKAGVGLVVLLSLVPVVRGAARVVKGGVAFNSGVRSLVAAGLPEAEAQRLMLAAGVFQSERATLRIVDSLGDALRRGEGLSGVQIAQMRRVFGLMVERLPVAERTAISASFAVSRLETAQEFFAGVALTERHLAGLQRLMPEVLAVLKGVARDEPLVVERIALMSSKSPEVAGAIDQFYLILGQSKSRFLSTLVTQTGADVLKQIGRRTVNISEELAAFVRKAGNSIDAYQRLMHGLVRGRRNIPGLAALLSEAQAGGLPATLLGVQGEFPRVFLTANQLAGLARLSAGARQVLRGASDGHLRSVATYAADSTNAASAIDQIVLQLGSQVKAAYLPEIMQGLGSGILQTMGRTGLRVADDLIREVSMKVSARSALQTLLYGSVRRGVRVGGLLDQVASRLTNMTEMQMALRDIGSRQVQGQLFSRWMVANPTVVEGVSAIVRLEPTLAQARIERIYQAVSGNATNALDIIRSVGQIARESPNASGLYRILGELGSGAEKTMGASLTVTYAVRRFGGRVSGFEREVRAFGKTRQYDMVVGDLQYEFKYWLGFGGRPAARAADEFAKDVILNVAGGFRNLRWVISRDAMGNFPAIQSMMRGVFARPDVQQALRAQRISVPEALRRLEAAQQWLIEFF